VLVISRPARGEVVETDALTVEWASVGAPADEIVVWLNGRKVARGLSGESATIDLSSVPDGRVTLRLLAPGTKSRYRLSSEEDSLPLERLEPASAEVTFVLRRTARPTAAGASR